MSHRSFSIGLVGNGALWAVAVIVAVVSPIGFDRVSWKWIAFQ